MKQEMKQATNQASNQTTLINLGIATHMIAASRKIESELSPEKSLLWQTVLQKAIRPGATLNYSWWLFSQWLLCKIGDVFVEESAEDYLCTEVCTLYELGCNNLAVWQGIIVKLALCQNSRRTEQEEKAIAALAQIAQTAINLIQLENAETDFTGETLDLCCAVLLTLPKENLSREAIYEQFGSQFLHSVSLA
ncbi:hypothetical protein BH11CYA1_BH11CYA1_12460 [soil metagenome]